MDKWFDGPLKDAVEVGDDHAIVANRYSPLYRWLQSVEELPMRDHASTALDDHSILANVGNLI